MLTDCYILFFFLMGLSGFIGESQDYNGFKSWHCGPSSCQKWAGTMDFTSKHEAGYFWDDQSLHSTQTQDSLILYGCACQDQDLIFYSDVLQQN